MKFLSTLSILSIAALTSTYTQAADASKELEALILDHDRAVVAALEPVNRRYQAQLEALQRRATQTNDLETALKIKKILDEMGDSGSNGNNKADIVGTWNFEHKPTGAKLVVKFLADGTYVIGAEKSGTWEIKGKQLIVTHTINVGVIDRYDLPVRSGRLAGMNSNSQGDFDAQAGRPLIAPDPQRIYRYCPWTGSFSPEFAVSHSQFRVGMRLKWEKYWTMFHRFGTWTACSSAPLRKRMSFSHLPAFHFEFLTSPIRPLRSAWARAIRRNH